MTAGNFCFYLQNNCIPWSLYQLLNVYTVLNDTNAVKLTVAMKNAVMPSVIILTVITLNVFMLNVTASFAGWRELELKLFGLLLEKIVFPYFWQARCSH